MIVQLPGSDLVRLMARLSDENHWTEAQTGLGREKDDRLPTEGVTLAPDPSCRCRCKKTTNSRN